MDLECPSSKTLAQIDSVSRAHHDSRLGETATLALGALLRKHRFCHNQTRAAKLQAKIEPDDEHPGGSGLEAALNRRLAAAVRHLDTDDAETTLLAMANSGAAVHLPAIAVDARQREATAKL